LSDLELVLVVAIVALSAGLSKGGLGGALGGLITPLLSLVMPSVKEAVALALPLFIVGDWLSVRAYWKQWDAAILKLTLPLALLGVVLGTYLLVNLPDGILRDILGTAALVVGVYKLTEPRLKTMRYQARSWHGVLVGFISGAGSAIASAGGPVYTAYLLLQNIPPTPFIATTAIFFAITNIARVPYLAGAGVFERNQVLLDLLFVPVVFLGVWLGRRLVQWIDPFAFERLMIFILILAGVVLIIQ